VEKGDTKKDGKPKSGTIFVTGTGSNSTVASKAVQKE
jgi:hypothetical protein